VFIVVVPMNILNYTQVATKPGSELAETSCEKRRQDICGAKICARQLLAIKNGDVVGIILRWSLFDARKLGVYIAFILISFLIMN
jgi:hypothetical protein